MSPNEPTNLLAGLAIRQSAGHRRRAVRLLIDAAVGLVMGGDAADRKWASEVLLNVAADADPDLDEIFGDDQVVH
jgi:hypothetical protein